MPTDDENYILPIQFYMPLVKSKGAESRHGEKLWAVEGVAATDHVDQQGEKLILRNMDISPFLKSGVFNWDHGNGPEDILGEPLDAKIIEKSNKPSIFWVKGWLYKHVPRAQAVWNHLQELEKGEQPITRKFGWSVQGGVLERKGNELTKSIVRHVAVTHQPVNADTWAKCVNTLVKSLTIQNQPTAVAANPIQDLIYSSCKNGCLDKSSGNFRNGFHGLLDHLTLCKGVPVQEARELSILLARGQV
jgi:hypothetical protein